MIDSTHQLVTLLTVIAMGLALGRCSVAGISLGTSGVVFVALAAGHFGFAVPPIAGDVGIMLFVYCLGIGAGPSFLRTFVHRGRALAVMTVAMMASAWLAAWLVARTMGLGPGLASGLFGGALTSTPALAAAAERLPGDAAVAVGFGIAYPFGVIGVIVFVQLVPRILDRWTPTEPDDATADDWGPITRELVEVTNPGVVGKRLRDVVVISRANCQISRILIDDTLQPIPARFQLELGQRLLIVGAANRLPEVIEVLGQVCGDVNYRLDLERQRRRVVVTRKELIGHSLEQLHLLSRFGVTISRITRQDVEFVPSPQERIQFGDALTVVGEPGCLEEFVKFAGHRERTLDETDLISLATGLVLGVLVGRIKLSIGSETISLGLAGGPLLVGLVLGHLGKFGPLVGRMPRAARLLLGDVGLALFLAQAGSEAGREFISVVCQYGLSLGLAAAVIVTIPLAVGLVMSRFVLHFGLWEAFGGICGAMTSTPGLGVVTAAVDSSLPATSYATVYPLALILVTILAPLLISRL